LTQPEATSPLNLGYLTVVKEPGGYLGGYLVTNQWGRPLEFRLSTPVQPNRTQQILYAETLEPYVCGDLIGKTLVEKTTIPVQIVVTDTEAALELRHKLEFPVALIGKQATVRNHPAFPGDRSLIDDLLKKVGGKLDLAEPFQRIREAMAEARKMGGNSRN
jgi:hypothetical protein